MGFVVCKAIKFYYKRFGVLLLIISLPFFLLILYEEGGTTLFDIVPSIKCKNTEKSITLE